MDGAANFSWILPDLAVGGSFPPERTPALACDHGIGAVIDLRQEACDDRAALAACGLTFLHLPTLDRTGVSQPMLDAAVAFAAAAARDGRRLLIHCQHGVGRSATATLCVLADRGRAPLEALRLAKDARALISPSELQYQAWAVWLARHGRGPAPSYRQFGLIAYRHLASSA